MALFSFKSLNFLPNFKFSSVLSIPAQLIGNGLVTVANVIKTAVDDVVAPMTLVGNALVGKPFDIVHALADTIIDTVTSTLSDVGSTLGATVNLNDRRLKSETINTELKLDHLSKITNFKTSHQIDDAVTDQPSDTSITLSQGLKVSAKNDPVSPRHDWQNFNHKTAPSSFSKAFHAVELSGQKSYRVSDDTFRQVQELYQQFSEAPSLQVKNLWRPIYSAIKNDLLSNNAVDKGTRNWLKVAEAVATANPKSFLYQYVRLGTEKSLAEKGIHFSNEDFYQASNILIKTLADNFINVVKDAAGNIVVPIGYLPSSDGQYGLVHMDATQALNNLGGTLADWSGITPAGLLDHYLGVDTSKLNGGASRPFSWYLELFGDVVKANFKAGASLIDVVSQIANEGLNFIGQFINGELFHHGFSSKDQLVNTLTQLAYTYAGDFAGSVAIATNLFNPKTNIITTLIPFGTTLHGKAGNDVIKGGMGHDKIYAGNGDDLLFGGLGNDILDGGDGINVLVGGRGNDTYYVNSNHNFVLEHAQQGIDTVLSTAEHFHLSKNVENLILSGQANISGTGNAENNMITGNLGNNSLFGGAGNDTLEAKGGLFNLLNGGTGNDTLIGSLGNETYEFELGFGQDLIQEKGGNDIIKFGQNINIDDLLIKNTGVDKIISIQGTTDQIKIKDWELSVSHQIESIQFHNGDRFDLQKLEYHTNFYA
ncbi:MAG: hypothetical protein H9855_14255 [Candidatus Acinetobacter avistercoris]|uniref:calcium-binding protein n=1 Tax=Acinetobacter sp. KS-LM10 TaxID=3120518 RepID=UPI001F9A3F90|nr:hypothetical protein [Candidatus Acinetobacter avistercoris]